MSDIFTGRLATEIPYALRAICDALSDATSLHEFDISDNTIGEYADALAPLLSRNTSIRVLKLNNDGLSPASATIVAHAIRDSLQRHAGPSNLRVLVCGRHHLEDGAAPAWGSMFAAHGGLTAVDLASGWIGAACLQAVVEGLAKCRGLRHLNLYDNLGTDTETDAWLAFAQALRSWTRLRFCNIASCCLGNAGLGLLLAVFAEKRHTELETLVLDSNGLDGSVYATLLPVVTEFLPGLRTLSLSDNVDLRDNDNLQMMGRILTARHGELMLEENLERKWPEPGDALDDPASALPAVSAHASRSHETASWARPHARLTVSQ